MTTNKQDIENLKNSIESLKNGANPNDYICEIDKLFGVDNQTKEEAIIKCQESLIALQNLEIDSFKKVIYTVVHNDVEFHLTHDNTTEDIELDGSISNVSSSFHLENSAGLQIKFYHNSNSDNGSHCSPHFSNSKCSKEYQDLITKVNNFINAFCA